MAKTKISEFSATPANNTDIDSINLAEGCAPSGINDAIRELMSQLKDFQAGTAGDSFNGPVGTTTAAVGAFTNLTASGTTTLSGNQVINVTDNTNAALRITQLGTGNALLVEDSTNPDSSPFVIDASGQVTMGSATRSTIGSITPNLLVQNATSGTANGMGIVSWLASTAGSKFAFGKSRSTSIGTAGIVSSGDTIATVSFAGDDGVGFIDAASITVGVDGTPGLNDMPGRLVFSTTADGASSPTERVRIDSAGQVGIGNTPTSGRTFSVGKNITGGVNGIGVASVSTTLSDVTSASYGFFTSPATQATAFTLSSLYHYGATQGTIGAGSTVTNQYGFNASASLTGATNNYGFHSNIAAGTGRYNFYAAGTADNYFAGNLILNGGTANGVPYLNGSKVLTSGSALTFDGSNLLTTGQVIAGGDLKANSAGTGNIGLNLARSGGTTADWYNYIPSGSADLVWYKGSELMRLTSTGLGIGTSSITDKLTLGSGRIKINTGGLALYMGNDGTDNALQLVSGASIKFQSGSGYATNMLLDSSGNLGLGVTPAYKIDVSGDVNVTGSYRVNGVATTGLTGGQTGSAPLYGARAWVNFNGTGTVAIRASGNVSSITDNGVGDYTVNFTTAMPDSNYSAVGSVNNSTGSTSASAARSLSAITYTTSSVRLVNQIGSGATADQDLHNVAIFR